MDSDTPLQMLSGQMGQAAEVSTICSFTPPPTLAELDRRRELELYHDKCQKLQQEIQGSFPNKGKSRYENVYVLLISWGEDDPKLPAYLELDELEAVFSNWYGFSTEKWVIPHEKSHNQLNRKVMEFIDLGGDSRRDLKIIYYGGHGRLTKGRQPLWTNLPDPDDKNYRQVLWGGIQNNLEQAQSDGLILLDCCESGVANTDDGSGTTELIAACGFDSAANPVGSNSFTHALIVELKDLRQKAPYTTSFLFNNILSRLSKDMPEGPGPGKKSPVHVTLTENSKLPQPIQLSPLPHNSAEFASGRRSNLLSSTSFDVFSAPKITEDEKLGNYLPLTPDLAGFQDINSKPPPITFHFWMPAQYSFAEFPIKTIGDWLRMIPVSVERMQIGSGTVDIHKILKLMQRIFAETIQAGDIPLALLKSHISQAQEELRAICLLLDQKLEIAESVDDLDATISEGLSEISSEIKEQSDRAAEAAQSLEHALEIMFKALAGPGELGSSMKAGFSKLARKLNEVLSTPHAQRNPTGHIYVQQVLVLQSLLEIAVRRGFDKHGQRLRTRPPLKRQEDRQGTLNCGSPKKARYTKSLGSENSTSRLRVWNLGSEQFGWSMQVAIFAVPSKAQYIISFEVLDDSFYGQVSRSLAEKQSITSYCLDSLEVQPHVQILNEIAEDLRWFIRSAAL